MDDDTRRAIEQYRGWIVEKIIELENGLHALQIRSPDGSRTALVTSVTAMTSDEEDEPEEPGQDGRS